MAFPDCDVITDGVETVRDRSSLEGKPPGNQKKTPITTSITAMGILKLFWRVRPLLTLLTALYHTLSLNQYTSIWLVQSIITLSQKC